MRVRKRGERFGVADVVHGLTEEFVCVPDLAGETEAAVRVREGGGLQRAVVVGEGQCDARETGAARVVRARPAHGEKQPRGRGAGERCDRGIRRDDVERIRDGRRGDGVLRVEDDVRDAGEVSRVCDAGLRRDGVGQESVAAPRRVVGREESGEWVEGHVVRSRVERGENDRQLVREGVEFRVHLHVHAERGGCVHDGVERCAVARGGRAHFELTPAERAEAERR